jgi:voltage-gated potassium channel
VRPAGRPRFVGFVFTVFLLGLITLSITEIGTVFLGVMLGIVLAAIASFYLLCRVSKFFVILLTNFLGVYACMYLFFVMTNFQTVAPWAVEIGFTFPVVAFVVGALLRRKAMLAIVQSDRIRDERHLGRTFLWLVPVSLIGALTFLVPGHVEEPGAVNAVFLGAMAAIGVIVLFASRDVALFLLDAGVLFEEFFERSTRLLVPSFAFLSFYSLLVIVFGCIYRILDRFTAAPQFLVGGKATEIGFSDALYFSVITVSTVGYGDVVPLGDSVRVIAAIQIVLGVLLLLFGFSEIIAYTREHGGRREG